MKYRVTRRVFSEPVTSKLHLLSTKNLACHLKTPKVIRISAIHTQFFTFTCAQWANLFSQDQKFEIVLRDKLKQIKFLFS